MSDQKIAIILIRGTIGTHPDVKKTLELLRLNKKHTCVVVDNNEINKGMLQVVKDYTTYGLIDEATFTDMLKKRGELIGQAKVSSDTKVDAAKIAKEYFAGKVKLKELELQGLKPFFRLHPPIGGFERKGIKMPFGKGGVLGDRKDAISKLIAKML